MKQIQYKANRENIVYSFGMSRMFVLCTVCSEGSPHTKRYQLSADCTEFTFEKNIFGMDFKVFKQAGGPKLNLSYGTVALRL